MKKTLLLAAVLGFSGCGTKSTPQTTDVNPNAEAVTSDADVDAAAPPSVSSAGDGLSGDASIVSVGATGKAPVTDGRGDGPTESTSDGGVSSAAAISPDGGDRSDAGADFVRPHLVVSDAERYWSLGDLAEASEATAAIVVDESETHQTWLGFSGGLNEAGWNALGALSAADRTAALELLFGPSGLHLTMGQIPIGSGESALGRYFPSEVDGDYEMEHFTIERDEVNLIPYVEAARAVNPELRFWAVPWTPPPWMKTNLSADRGSIRNEPEVLQAYALYLARFIEAYSAKNIDIGALHLQAEADTEGSYPSCLWTAVALRDFAKQYLLPTLDARELGLELWAGDFIGAINGDWIQTFLDDPELAPRLAGVGLAWGMKGRLGDVADTYTVPIFQTQHEHGNAPFREGHDFDRAPNDHAYGLETWALLQTWLQYSSAYNVVNLVLDSQGWNLNSQQPWPQNALLVVDRETSTVYTTPAYHALRHLSQFLDPGAVRLGIAPSSDALAFKNPNGSIVAVLHNSQSAPLATTLGVREAVFSLTVPAQGWATVFVD